MQTDFVHPTEKGQTWLVLLKCSSNPGIGDVCILRKVMGSGSSCNFFIFFR
jgi:hypothetical protein